MSTIATSEPFIAAMELMDCALMCGGQRPAVADFIIKFMTDEGLFTPKGDIHPNYITRPASPIGRPYTPRHDPAGWTPRLPDKEWWPLRGRVFRRDGFLCAYCKEEDGGFEIDHIVPVTRGGSHDMSNLCVACKPCNASKGDRLLSEWRGRYR